MSSDQRSNPAKNDVRSLASEALSIVAQRGERTVRLRETHLARLYDAALDRSDESYRVAVQHILSAGVSPEAIVDHAIPSLARRMGEEWVDDTASFASVTLGSSRLTSLLRDLSAIWSADTSLAKTADQRSALVIAPPHAQHTLGASVLASQLRRRGLSVHLNAGEQQSDISQMSGVSFDTIAISASIGDGVENIQRLVQSLKRNKELSALPVVVGGTMLDEYTELNTRIEADLATMDVDHALQFCGIS